MTEFHKQYWISNEHLRKKGDDESVRQQHPSQIAIYDGGRQVFRLEWHPTEIEPVEQPTLERRYEWYEVV